MTNGHEDLGQRAFEKTLKGDGLTPEESEALFTAKGIYIQPTVRTQAEAIMHAPAKPSHPEQVHEEHARLRLAVDEAVERKIVREEVFSGPAGSRDFYILSSSHFGIQDFDPGQTPEDTKMSHAQLFQLAHLFHGRQMKSPIFVEGRCFRHGYTNPIPEVMRQEGTELMSAQVQSRFAEQPEELVALMSRHQTQRKSHGIAAPNFYLYTAYPHIAGGHLERSDAQLKKFSDVWMPWMEKFTEKYRPLFQANASVSRGTLVQMKIPTGWSGARPCLQIGENWVFADDVARECEWFLQFGRELEIFDQMREEDVSDLMLSTRQDLVPLCSYGAAHSLRIMKQLKAQAACSVHVLTPLASTHLDHLRSTGPINSAESSVLSIDLVQKLLYAAQHVPPLQR